MNALLRFFDCGSFGSRRRCDGAGYLLGFAIRVFSFLLTLLSPFCGFFAGIFLITVIANADFGLGDMSQDEGLIGTIVTNKRAT